MMFYRRIIRYVALDLLLHRKLVIRFISVIPILLIISVLPIAAIVLLSWSTFSDLIRSIRFEFFYCPLFLIFLGALLKNMNDWTILRRFSKREEIISYQAAMVVAAAALIVLPIGLIGYCIYIIMNALEKAGITYTSIIDFKRIEQTPSDHLFIIVFFLVFCVVGAGFVLLCQLLKNQILAVIVTIAIVIFERFTVSIIPIVFHIYAIHLPIRTIITLVVTFILLIVIARLLSNNKDFYGEHVE